MRFILPLVFVFAIGCASVSTKSGSDLCLKCSRMMYTCDVGSCEKCHKTTSSGAFALCRTCAVKLDQCASCRKSISGEPPDDPDEPREFIVTAKRKDKRPGVADGLTRSQVNERSAVATEQFEASLRKWLDANGLSNVEIVNRFRAFEMLVIKCSLTQAALIEKAPGVGAISRGD